uniref:caspase family protein n=1 Tax=Candidatus Electronema sp. TaxID=2698783 RepID=UPI004055CA12
MKRLLLLIALTILPAAAQAQAVVGFGRFHALVIGNQNYRHLSKLNTPLADAEAVAKVLEEQYGFTVELLLDATWEQTMRAIADLRKTANREEDNLLIYYAGHGYLNKKAEVEYWQPVDAERDNDIYWLPTSRITTMLKELRARHALVVADSCYSGSLLMRDSGAELPDGSGLDELLRRMQERRSRTALTSGGEEPVLDGGGSGHSIFAKVFLEVLKTNQSFLDGYSLFARIRRPVALNAPQTPQYGDIRMTGHERGDFLLVPKELQGVTLPKPSGGKVDLTYLQRGGQKGRTIGQYIDHGDGTVTDTKSGLMWKRCPEGLSGVNCEQGKTEEYEWDDAVKRFKDVEYAGYADWRLPTIDELKTLVYCSNGVKDKKDGWCNEGSVNSSSKCNFFWLQEKAVTGVPQLYPIANNQKII